MKSHTRLSEGKHIYTVCGAEIEKIRKKNLAVLYKCCLPVSGCGKTSIAPMLIKTAASSGVSFLSVFSMAERRIFCVGGKCLVRKAVTGAVTLGKALGRYRNVASVLSDAHDDIYLC